MTISISIQWDALPKKSAKQFKIKMQSKRYEERRRSTERKLIIIKKKNKLIKMAFLSVTTLTIILTDLTTTISLIPTLSAIYVSI